MYIMDNVVKNLMNKETKAYLKALVSELSKKSTEDIVGTLAQTVNGKTDGLLNIRPTVSGGAHITIDLTREEIKYLFTELMNLE